MSASDPENATDCSGTDSAPDAFGHLGEAAIDCTASGGADDGSAATASVVETALAAAVMLASEADPAPGCPGTDSAPDDLCHLGEAAMGGKVSGGAHSDSTAALHRGRRRRWRWRWWPQPPMPTPLLIALTPTPHPQRLTLMTAWQQLIAL
jgi:hypothetical protein